MSYTDFRNVPHFGYPSLTNQLEVNLKGWLDWGLLRAGGFINITTGTQGPYGGDYSILHEVNDVNYTGDTVFQSIRKDWIWENSGVDYSPPTGGTTYNPTGVQVYVNNSGITTGTSGYTHYINYPLGRVVFDSIQTGTIKAQYSYRAVQVYLTDDLNFWFEVNYDSWNPVDTDWSQNITSGTDYAMSASNRMQLPCIVIEPITRSSTKPFELGTLSKFNKQDVLFHVMSQDRYTRNNLIDYLRLQEEKTIILYDIAAVANSGLNPLDYRGMKVDNPQTYASLVSNNSLVYNTARLEKISVTDVKTKNPNLYWAVVRGVLEIIA